MVRPTSTILPFTFESPADKGLPPEQRTTFTLQVPKGRAKARVLDMLASTRAGQLGQNELAWEVCKASMMNVTPDIVGGDGNKRKIEFDHTGVADSFLELFEPVDLMLCCSEVVNRMFLSEEDQKKSAPSHTA